MTHLSTNSKSWGNLTCGNDQNGVITLRAFSFISGCNKNEGVTATPLTTLNCSKSSSLFSTRNFRVLVWMRRIPPDSQIGDIQIKAEKRKRTILNFRYIKRSSQGKRSVRFMECQCFRALEFKRAFSRFRLFQLIKCSSNQWTTPAMIIKSKLLIQILHYFLEHKSSSLSLSLTVETRALYEEKKVNWS